MKLRLKTLIIVQGKLSELIIFSEIGIRSRNTYRKGRNVTGGARIIRNLLRNEYGQRGMSRGIFCIPQTSSCIPRARRLLSQSIIPIVSMSHAQRTVFHRGALYYPSLSRLWQGSEVRARTRVPFSSCAARSDDLPFLYHYFPSTSAANILEAFNVQTRQLLSVIHVRTAC